jgi:AcrR family transcriptional regulator
VAGSSPALVHHYFGTRQQLIEAILDKQADELIDLLHVDTRQPASVQLTTGLSIYLDYVTGHATSWVALLRAGTSADDPISAIARRVDDHALQMLKDAMHPDGPMCPSLALAFRGWIAYVKEVCLQWLGMPDLGRPAVEALLSLGLVGALQAAAAADPAAQGALDALIGNG